MSENAHRIVVRVYYEDTDFSGRVYHASYLRFLERGRTEWLRALGFEHSALAQTRTAFAVTKLQAEFHAPAVIDDLLDVATSLQDIRGAVLAFSQTIVRGSAVLTTACVDVVTLKGDKAARPPRDILAAFVALKRR